MVKEKCGIKKDFAMDAILNEQQSRLSFEAGNFGASFIISGILAIVFKTMVAPLERIKLILQTQASSLQIEKTERSAYSGLWNALIRIPREQGFLSLWRGNFLNICRYFPTQAINFSFYDIYYDAFQQRIEPRTKYSHIILPFLTGGAVGITSCALLYPLTFCTTRISVDVGDNEIIKREFYNINDCMRKVYKSDGCRGFYQGVTLSSLGVILYRSAYFGVYTTGKRAYLNSGPGTAVHNESAPFFVSLFFAQLASMVASLVAYPLDTISRQQMLSSGRGSKNYASARQVISAIKRKDGLIGVYRGILANLLSTMCGSLLLVTYDVVKQRYRTFNEPKAHPKN